MTTLFWLDNPKIILNKKEMFEIWPFINNKLSLESKFNSFTRTILILTFIFYLFNKKTIILLVSFLTILILVIIYYLKRKKSENFQNIDGRETTSCITEDTNYKMPTNINPLANNLLSELPSKPIPLYKDEKYYTPEFKKSAPSFNNEIAKKINKNSKNISIKNKLLKDLGKEERLDKSNFDMLMRQFYTVPNIQNPSNQKNFAEFCYGGMNSRKILKTFD